MSRRAGVGWPGPGAGRRLGACALGAALALTAGRRADAENAENAETKEACIGDNEQGQSLQLAGHLLEARRRFLACARDACPPLLRADCAKRLDDITSSLPTVVIDARDRTGADTTEVSLSADGVEVAHTVLGTEIELDPGAHVLRFQARDGDAREQRVVLRVGDRRRPIHVDFSTRPAIAAVVVPQPASEPRQGEAHGSAAPWVLGSVAAASAVSFGVFAGLGYAKEENLAHSCAPGCLQSQVTPVRTYYVLSDVALGVGVAAAAATALSIWLEHRHRSPSSWRIDLRTLRTGAGVSVDGRW